MSLKEINELASILNDEISRGIDVEFNKSWLNALQNSIVASLTKTTKTRK